MTRYYVMEAVQLSSPVVISGYIIHTVEAYDECEQGTDFLP